MTDDEALAKECALTAAPYINRIRIEIRGQMVKLFFAEQTPDAGMIISRAAVLMSPEDAVDLKEMIDGLIKITKIEGRPN